MQPVGLFTVNSSGHTNHKAIVLCPSVGIDTSKDGTFGERYI